MFAMEVLAQDYELNIIQRRKYDQIHAEIWVKSLVANPSIIGDAQIWFEYNRDYLVPNTNTIGTSADSVSSDLTLTNPQIQINSQFNSTNGYASLSVLNNSTNIGIRARLVSQGSGGFKPSSDGRGAFLGKIIFDIKNSPAINSQTNIKIISSNPQTKITDINGKDISKNINFKQTSNFTIIGVTLLSPIFSNQVIDRDKSYGALTNTYQGVGYPIYFERSVNPQLMPGPANGNVAYQFEYNNGAWLEIGRLAEHNNQMYGSSAYYRTGDIARPSKPGTYVITTVSGQPLGNSNFRNPVRVLWATPSNIKDRKSKVKLRITMLGGSLDSLISKREKTNLVSESPSFQAMGTYFTSLLNGSSEYFKTQNAFSNPTQLSVEAWVNPTKINSGEVGLVVSSGGVNQTEIFGKKEGAWMLYLKDGKYPAFRARENQNNGNNGYLVDLVAKDPINISEYSDSEDGFSRNWTHIAAVLKNSVAYLYVDGELVASDETYANTNYRLLITSHPIWIGVNPNGKMDSKNYFAGGIKEVKVWRSAIEQDTIRKYASGIELPSTIDPNLLPDTRTGLDLYFKLNDDKFDFASNAQYQNGANNLDFYQGTQVSVNSPFVPDLPHGKITSPSVGDGLLIESGVNYPVRYLTYNLGDNSKMYSKDVYLEVSTDGGFSWIQIENNFGVKIGANSAADAEVNKATWEPFQSNDVGAGLRDAVPYSKNAILRITGHEGYNQRTISNNTGQFVLSRNLSLRKDVLTNIYTDSTKNYIPKKSGLFTEIWLRPHRFPNQTEQYFPILTMIDTASGSANYKLSLTQNGTLSFSFNNSKNELINIISDSSKKLVEPLSYSVDSSWSHIAYYFNPYDSKNQFILWIDGKEIGTNIDINKAYDPNYDSLDYKRLYLGYLPAIKPAKSSLGFEGDIKELRFWKGFPANKNYENGDLTQFIQGALTIQADRIKRLDTLNLINSYSFNGGLTHYNGKIRTIAGSIDSSAVLNFYGSNPKFVGTSPYFKLVEPEPYSVIKQNNKNLRLRWVGFGLDNNGFTSGQRFGNPPSLEYSERGGAGNSIVPYKYVGSLYWLGNVRNSFSVPDSANYRFKEFGFNNYYAVSLDVSIANPDLNKDNINLDQGALPIVKKNLRFRLSGRYVVESQNFPLVTESPLYTIIPGENFTLRVLLEAKHSGKNIPIDNIKAGYENGGFRISLYENKDGNPGVKVGEAENIAGYDDLSMINQKGGSNNFSNLPFLFPELETGEYWLLVEQKNHLAIMSRYPVPFIYEGDDKKTWTIESGWDFTSWNGVAGNTLNSKNEDPWEKSSYTAYGNSESNKDSIDWMTTGLNYNDGKLAQQFSPFPAMVAGDVNQDGSINTSDINEILKNTAGTNIQYDLNADSIVNAFDRELAFRNIGKSISFSEIAGFLSNNTNTLTPIIYKDNNKQNSTIENNNNNIKQLTTNQFLASTAFEIQTNTTVKDSIASVEFFIKSNGESFKLGNTSLAFVYDTTNLSYINYENKDVIFSNKNGYLASFSAPTEQTSLPYSNIRTIEIVLSNNSIGTEVPTKLTSLGKLNFKIKSKNSIIQFKWHKSTIIYNSEKSNISSFADKGDIEAVKQFKIQLLTPDGKEDYGTEQNLEIKWINEGNPIQLEYYNGKNWQKISKDSFSSTITSYVWTLPNVEILGARVRLVDAQLQVELDKSEPFNIERRMGQIISPSANDGLYKGGDLISIYYTITGYSKVDLEYSTDGGETWSVIKKNVDGKSEKTQWILPKINSNVFYIRIRSGNDIIDISDRMKVLSGELDLYYPNENSVFQSGTSERIRWNSTGVGKFTLQFSLDAGDNWLNLAKDLNSASRYYVWDVPSFNNNTVMLRAIWSDDPEMLYDITPMFSIELSTSAEFSNYTQKRFKLLNNSTINDNIIIFSEKSTKALIKIYDLEGKEIIGKELNLKQGENQIEIDNLSQGIYILFIQDSENIFTEKFLKL